MWEEKLMGPGCTATMTRPNPSMNHPPPPPHKIMHSQIVNMWSKLSSLSIWNATCKSYCNYSTCTSVPHGHPGCTCMHSSFTCAPTYVAIKVIFNLLLRWFGILFKKASKCNVVKLIQVFVSFTYELHTKYMHIALPRS